VVYTDHARRFAATLAGANTRFADNLFEVRDFGPQTAILLKERVERGEILVDRRRPHARRRQRPARARDLSSATTRRFPQGPVVLGYLLGCPVYLFFCLKDSAALPHPPRALRREIELPHRDRKAAIDAYVAQYARRLEWYCREGAPAVVQLLSTSGMSLSAEVEIEIPFFDVDAMRSRGTAITSSISRWRAARCCARSTTTIRRWRLGFHFPVVEIYLRYVKPARYGQIVLGARRGAGVREPPEDRLPITDRASGERLTKGWSVQVAIDAKRASCSSSRRDPAREDARR
jgi:acyl-CoA thioesterase FadM